MQQSHASFAAYSEVQFIRKGEHLYNLSSISGVEHDYNASPGNTERVVFIVGDNVDRVEFNGEAAKKAWLWLEQHTVLRQD